jgi:hypothetical protein
MTAEGALHDGDVDHDGGDLHDGHGDERATIGQTITQELKFDTQKQTR